MATQVDTVQRDVVFVEEAHVRPMMGLSVLESLPSRHIPYSAVDPFILVHEAVVKVAETSGMDTTHPHRRGSHLQRTLRGLTGTH